MSESSSVRRALSLVRDEISPTLDDKARLRARIVAPAALTAGAPARDATPDRSAASVQSAGPAPSLTRWAALKAAGALGATVGLALLGAGGAVGFWLGHDAGARAGAELAVSPAQSSPPGAPLAEGAAPPPAAASPAATGAASAASASSAEASSLASSPAAGASPRAEPPRSAEPPPTDVPPRAHPRRRAEPNPLNDELALLRRVERALRNNDPALARALLGELDARFPDSRLGEERSAARRIADCRSGELGAREEARAFLRQHGASVYRQRIALACGLDADSKEKSTPAGSRAAPMTNAGRADTHVR